MKNLSLGGVGMYSFMLVSFFNLLNIPIPQTQADDLVLAVMTIVTFFTWAYGQLRRNDLILGLFRK